MTSQGAPGEQGLGLHLSHWLVMATRLLREGSLVSSQYRNINRVSLLMATLAFLSGPVSFLVGAFSEVG